MIHKAETESAEVALSSSTSAHAISLGRFSSHELAPALVNEVARLLKRYIVEVVMHHSLCPFLKDVESGLGKLIVILDDEKDVDAAADAVVRASSPIVHLVFPLWKSGSSEFERFGSAVNNALYGKMDEAPVHATFHPELVGATDTAFRLIGLLRQAPDPFVQFVPGGVQPNPPPKQGNPERIFEQLTGDVLESTLAKLAEIKADRDATYAPYRRAFGLPA